MIQEAENLFATSRQYSADPLPALLAEVMVLAASHLAGLGHPVDGWMLPALCAETGHGAL